MLDTMLDTALDETTDLDEIPGVVDSSDGANLLTCLGWVMPQF